MFLLDTNMCIFIIKKKYEKVLEKLKQNKQEGLYISSITLAKLEFGIENASLALLPMKKRCQVLRIISDNR